MSRAVIDDLIVVKDGVLGGAEQLLLSIANFSLRSGKSCVVVFLDNNGKENWEHYISKECLIVNPDKGVLSMLTFLKYTLSQYECRNTLASNIHVNALLGIYRKFHFLKTDFLIVRESTSIFTRFTGLKLCSYKLRYWLGYHMADKVVCQTEYMKNQLELGWRRSKSWDVVHLANPIEKQSIEEKGTVSFTNDFGQYVVSAGRLIQEKGFDILINAFANLKDKELNLVILGEGKERVKLEKLIDDLELQNRVHLLGFKSNPIPYFKNARLCMVSSRIEGFPNVLLQMMTVNTRVASTLCAGDIDKINGILTCEANNEKKLLEMILSALHPNFGDGNRLIFEELLQSRNINNYYTQLFSHA
ncbi:glycosyltransferase [bacterium]|nr:glycosyltransferase [bacterium]